MSLSRRVVGIIQARMGSSRLPEKTLMPIGAKPLLVHVMERTRAAQTLDDVCLATTEAPEDAPLLEFATQFGALTYTGSPDDVLDRYYQAASMAKADVIVRITADDPFKDPAVIDTIAGHLLAHPELDYVSNTLEPTYPEGLDVEVFTFDALATAWREASLASEREHVTPFIWKNPARFNLHNVRHSADLSHMRWTLDYEADLRFAREVYRRLEHKGLFSMAEILECLDAEPELNHINQGIERNSGYLSSIQKD